MGRAQHESSAIAAKLAIAAFLTAFFLQDARADESTRGPAPESASESASESDATPAIRARAVHGPGTHLTAAQSIDASVHRLAASLGLDPGQQEQLRGILVEQRRQLMQLRRNGLAAGADATSSVYAIYSQGRARIRALLTEEQKAKYPAEVPRDQTAPAQADLRHWLQLQEAGRRQGAETAREPSTDASSGVSR